MPLFLAGLTSIKLEGCELDTNPLPVLLTLPQLAAVTIQSATVYTGKSVRLLSGYTMPLCSSTACCLLPMSAPQQQVLPPAQAAGKSREEAAALRTNSSSGSGSGSSSLAQGDAAAAEHAGAFLNTSITSLALVDMSMHALPSCISQLVALQDRPAGLS
jgi:hypothetical protein